jgi:L-asparagine oxygenase
MMQTTTTLDPVEHLLSEDDADRLLRLADQLRGRYGTPDHPQLAAEAPLHLREVPDDLMLFLRRFVREEPAGAAVIRGRGVDDVALGPTPLRFDPPEPTDLSVTLAFYLALIGYGLGELFALSNLQNGRPVHNVLPVPGDELDKSGTSSASTLELHTEDAAHPARADYLLLECVRNHDKVPTVYSSLAQADLDPAMVEVLFQPRFIMQSEPDHVGSLGPAQQVPVLFGDPKHPYVAYDGYYLSVAPGDAEAQTALAHLTACLQASATDLLLEPGDLVIIDNYRAVHGRNPFPARFDGTDRWFMRGFVARDLRRSRRWRSSSGSPVIDVHAHSS